MAERHPITRPRAPFAWQVYLIDHGDGSHYVGGTRDIARRMREHRKDLGRKPSYVVLESGTSLGWREAEHRWIERLRGEGVRLTNKTAGRNGVQAHLTEARALLSRAGKGRPKTAEHAEKIGAAQRGVPKRWTEAGLKRIQATQFKAGQSASPETQFKAGNEIGAKTRFAKGSRSSFLGHKHSEETRQKMRDAHAKRSPEERRAITPRRAASIEKLRAYWSQFTPEQRGEMLRQRMIKHYARGTRLLT